LTFFGFFKGEIGTIFALGFSIFKIVSSSEEWPGDFGVVLGLGLCKCGLCGLCITEASGLKIIGVFGKVASIAVRLLTLCCKQIVKIIRNIFFIAPLFFEKTIHCFNLKNQGSINI
jgi:hypothetical protein